MLFKQKHRFSIRKFSFGVCSALLGTALIMGADSASAAETTTSSETQPADSSSDASATGETSGSTATEDASSTASEPVSDTAEPTADTTAEAQPEASSTDSTAADTATTEAAPAESTEATEQPAESTATVSAPTDSTASENTSEPTTATRAAATETSEPATTSGTQSVPTTYLRAAVEPVAQTAPTGTQVTPEVTVISSHRGLDETPTIYNNAGTSIKFSFGDQPLHQGDYFFVETQDVPIALPRTFRMKSSTTDGEGPVIATVERVNYESDFVRGTDSEDQSRFNLKNDGSLTTMAIKYKVTFTENVEGLKDVTATVAGNTSKQTLAGTEDRQTQFKVKINDKTVYTSAYTLPAWDDANAQNFKRSIYNTGFQGLVAQNDDRSKADYDTGNRTNLHAFVGMDATVYDYRTNTPGSDVGFLTETISDGLVQLSGQVGGMPDGFVTTVSSPTDPNKNTYTWDTDKLEVGQRLPVYYIPFEDMDTKQKNANADGGKLYVTPDNMYYTIEKISDDKRTITLRFHGDYSKPGRIITSFQNPMDDFQTGTSSRLGIKFDKDTFVNVGGTLDNSTITVKKPDGSDLTSYEFKATGTVKPEEGEIPVIQPGLDAFTSRAVHLNYDASATGIPVETTNPEQINKGTVIVQYVDENGNVLKEEVADVTDVDVETDYDTVSDNRPQEITVGDKTYELVPAGDYVVGSVSEQGNLTTSKLRDVYGATDVNGAYPTGKVRQGTNYVTYVYKEKPAIIKQGIVTVNYQDEEGNVIKDPVVDTPNSPVDTPYDTKDNRPEKITTEDGKTYERVPEKTIGNEEGKVVEGNTDVTYVYKEVKGNVLVHYIDTEGNPIADDAIDTPTTSTGVDYNTADDNKPATITKDGVKYELVPALTKGNEVGKVVEGTTEITYVYKKVEAPTPEAPTGDVIVHYKDEYGNTIAEDKVDTQDSKIDSPYDTTDNRPERITTPDGKTYERVPEKTEGKETGNVVEGTTDVTYVYKEVKGDVVVHYIDTEGNTLQADALDTPATSTGVDYNTADDNKPATITKDGVKYELVPVLTKGNEQGKVVEGRTEVTYVYKKVETPVTPEPTPEAPTGDVIVHYQDEEGNKIAEDKVDTLGSKIDTPYDTTDNRPERITTSDGKTYERVPEKTEGEETGSVVEGKTEVTYVYKEVKGDVIVHYIDTEGNPIADDAIDTPTTSTGVDYNTADDNKPATITKDGVKYELVPVLTKGNEQGKVVEGTTEITYVYKKVEEPTTPEVPVEEPGKYIPYIPVDPENPTDPNDPLNPPVDPNTGDPIDPIDYDETPEDPTDNPPLPDIDGFIPVDPKDSSEPLKPKDPNDPTKGYEPPTPKDPNDPTQDTPVPYVPAGTVTVHYEDENGNVIKDPTVDTAKSPVGTEYNTNENGTEIPKEITGKDGKVYELVKVKDGDQETGKVVKGNTDVTYIYKLKDPTTPEVPVEEPGKYIPYIPVDPENPTDPNDPLNPPVDPNTGDPIDPIDYDETPEDPTDNPPLPDIDGFIPVDPKDPSEPLKPKDPNDPTKGYEPPTPKDPNDPTQDTPVPYVPAGTVTVHYEDENGNVIKDPTVDTAKSPVGTEYNTNENGTEIPKEITGKDGQVYELVKVKDGDQETGKVVKGNTDVTYIYKLKDPTTPEVPVEEPGKYIPYIPVDPENPTDPNDPLNPPVDPNTGDPIDPIDYDETPEDPTDNPPLPDIDGFIPVDPKDPSEPLKPKDPNDPTKGYEPPTPKDPNDPTQDTPVPYVPAGTVTVHYEDENGNVIKDPTVDTAKSPVGTEYNTNENGTEIPKEITGKDGKVYELVKVKDGDQETGKVVKGNTDVTYIYKLKDPTTPEVPVEEPGKYIPYIPVDPENPTDPNDPLNPPVDPNTGDPIDPIDYDETPEDPTDNPPLPDIDGFIPVDPKDPSEPLKPKDPNDPTKGYEPPTPKDPNDPTQDTPVPYVPAGTVTVHYEDENGNVIKDPTVDTAKSPVGTEYNTNENGTEIPKEITGKDGKVYELVKVKDGDQETGKVVKGNTDVTYIYKLKDPTTPEVPVEEPGKYIPYIPVDPENPTDPNDPLNPPVDPNTGDPIDPIDYDETPEDPTDNPPLPDIDGFIPVDPKDPSEPLKPKDPNDPTKGYEPPTPKDPNDPTQDTPVPYVPAGTVTVHYQDENGNVIKDPTVDTAKSPVGTEYNTNENGTEIPKEITGKDGKVYELVKVKDGDQEIGKVVKGNTDVTYIYKLKDPTTPEVPVEEPGKYIPYIPADPENPTDPNDPLDPTNPNTGEPMDPVDYDETPEDPTDNPPLPDIDGFIPVDPKDPSEPLKPKDPNDPTKGYEPPTPKDPNDPTQDTPVPYVPAGTVTVHYEDENGNVIKDPTVDTPKSPVGTEYNTNENGEEIPKEIIGKDGKVYVLVKVKDGDEETGKVGKGNKDVTYIYKVKEDPEKPTPEEPGKPGTEEPGKPGTEEPGKPGTEEPGKPGTEEPGKPGTEEPGKPGTEEPGKPGTEEPGKPGTEEPGKPGTEEPGKPGTEEPGKPGQPEKPAMDQPSKDMDDKGMKQADKAMDKELPETGNTNNPFVTAFGFLALLAGVRLTKRNRRED